MGLREAIALRRHRVTSRAEIDHRRVIGASGSIDYGYDTVVATATLELKDRPSWLQVGQRVQIWLGWNGFVVSSLVGEIEDDGRKAWPHSKTIKCVGAMRKAERKTPTEVTYSSQSARTMVSDLLDKAGVDHVDIEGDDTTLATVVDITLAKGQSYWDLIQQIDAPWLCRTYDSPPDGIVKRRTITAIPTAGAAWAYTYPGNVLEIDRPLSRRTVKNRVEVFGLDGTTASRRGDSPYVDPDHDEIHEVRSDYIETDGICSDVALLQMPSVNRLTEQITITVAGNPLLHPGDTVSLQAATLGIATATPFWLKHITHTWGEDHFNSQLVLEGGYGEAGYELPKPPIPMFTFVVTKERFSVGGVPGTYYVVSCDASSTTDPDSDASSLTYAWANNKNADTGTAVYYATRFTEAQMGGTPKPTITLTASDGTNNASLTLTIDADIEQVLVENLYSAESAQAGATPDGGVNWKANAISATCTPEIAGEDHSYFGAGVNLYYTDDWLATAPTLVHTFGAAINWIWICETDANRVTVGLADGTVSHTNNASAGAGATWATLYSHASAVNCVVEAYTGGDYWVLVGGQVLMNNAVQWQLDGDYTAKRLALSFFSHYAGGDNGVTAQVKRMDGVVVGWPGGYSPATVLGLTHHIYDDILYAADEAGNFYRKPADSDPPAFAYVSNIGGGPVYHLIRDGSNPMLLYAACRDGIYKTYDGGVSWYLMRDLTGAGLDGLMIGYGSAPWMQITPVTVVSDSTAKAKTLWNGSGNDDPPDGWRDAGFDDSGWAAAVVTVHAPNEPPAGSESIWSSLNPLNNAEQALVRRTFAIGAGVVTSATLTVRFDDECLGFWINNIYILNDTTSSPGGIDPEVTVNINPQILLAGATNCIAVHGKNVYAAGAYIAWKLEIS